MDIVLIILTIAGSAASIYSVYHLFKNSNIKSWRSVCRGVLNTKQSVLERFNEPDLIIFLGVGGAIVGGMLASSFSRKPIIGIDRRYQWSNGQRMTFVDLPSKFIVDPKFKNVLLVTGEIYEGSAVLKALDHVLSQLPGSTIRTVSMYVWENSDFFPDFYGYKIPKRIIPPWRLQGSKRDSKVDKEISNYIPN